MRICFLADATSVHTQKWAAWFAQNGHQVHLISDRYSSDNRLRGIELHIVTAFSRKRALDFIFTARKVKRLLKEIRPDIVHAHFASNYGFLGALSGFHPLVVTAWGTDVLILPRQYKIFKWLVSYALKKADCLTCDAQHLAKEMVRLGALESKIVFNYYGIDTQKFSPQRKDAGFREKLGLKNGSLQVISTRHLLPLYDVETLVRAAPIILKDAPDTVFTIIGGGEQKVFLEDLAGTLGVRECFRFTGVVPSEELPYYLAGADVYVSTALSDGGLAASTAEAMSCGLPAVITDFGDNRKWLRDAEGGFLVPPKDPGALAEKVVYLLKDRHKRIKFGEINRKIIEDRDNYHKEMKNAEKLYRQLLEI